MSWFIKPPLFDECFYLFSILEKIETYWVVFSLVSMILLLPYFYIIPPIIHNTYICNVVLFSLSLFATISLYVHLFHWNFMRNLTTFFMMRKCLQRICYLSTHGGFSVTSLYDLDLFQITMVHLLWAIE